MCLLRRRLHRGRFVNGADANEAEVIRHAVHDAVGQHFDGVDVPYDVTCHSWQDGIGLMVSHRFVRSVMHEPVHANHVAMPYLVEHGFVELNATFPVLHRPDDDGHDVIADSMDLNTLNSQQFREEKMKGKFD